MYKRARGGHREKFYIRFRSPPPSGRSGTHGITGKDLEEAVSVYPAQWSADLDAWVIPPSHSSGLSYLHKLIRWSRRPRGRIKVYLVKGEEIGVGSDDEPLLKDLEVLEELDCENVLSQDFDLSMGTRRGWDRTFRAFPGKWGEKVPCEPLESHAPLPNPVTKKKSKKTITKPGRKPQRKYSPAQKKELQRILIGQLAEEVRAAKSAIQASRKTTVAHRKRFKELESSLREARAELKKKPKRAQIRGLPKEWQKQWVETYDDMRSRGIDKGNASAISWATIKRYCFKDEQYGQWVCMPHKQAFDDVKKDIKKAKDLRVEVG